MFDSSAAQRGHKDTPCDTVRRRQSRFQRRRFERSDRRGSVEFREAFEARSTLDEIIREGARKMLQSAIEAEVDASWPNMPIGAARRQTLIVRNGYLPSRELLTGAGSLQVKQPRVRDNAAVVRRPCLLLAQRPTPIFASQQVGRRVDPLALPQGNFHRRLSPRRSRPCWAKRSHSQPERHRSTQGEMVAGIRSDWSRRDLSQKHYVYFWADGIHVNVRLEDEANRRQCLLVLMGATSEGKKELIAVVDGYRESEQSWTELLLDLQQRGLSEAPLLAVGDGALGFWAALRKVFGEDARATLLGAQDGQRAQQCPKSVQSESQGRPPRDLAGRDAARPRTRRSITSWRNIERSTTPPATAWPKIATCC